MKYFTDYKKQYENTELWKLLASDRSEFADFIDEKHTSDPAWMKDFYWEEYIREVFDSIARMWDDFTEHDEDYDPCTLFLISPDRTEVYRHFEDKDMWQIRETKLRTGWKVLRYVHLSQLCEQEMKDYWLDDEE